jgi:hypothetical protein
MKAKFQVGIGKVFSNNTEYLNVVGWSLHTESWFSQYILNDKDFKGIIILTVFNNGGYDIKLRHETGKHIDYINHKENVTTVHQLTNDEISGMWSKVESLIKCLSDIG